MVYLVRPATAAEDALIAAYLRTIGCTRALLHASPQGEPVYKSLGFETSNEMWLEL